jgi:hypothetical protein
MAFFNLSFLPFLRANLEFEGFLGHLLEYRLSDPSFERVPVALYLSGRYVESRRHSMA